MRKPDIAMRLARQTGVSRAHAADQLDRVVHRILSNLKKGQPAPLPGLGRFTPRADGGIAFENEQVRGGGHDRR